MQASNVRLIYIRELRDQLRDRRTLFTVLILPLLLYPLLGVSFIRISQFMRAHPTDCWVIGYQDAASLGIDPQYEFPPLLNDDAFNPEFCPEDEASLLQIKKEDVLPDNLKLLIEQAIQNPNDDSEEGKIRHLEIQKELLANQVDLLLYFPPYDAEAEIPPVEAVKPGEEPTPQLDSSIPRLFIFGNLSTKT